MLSQLKVSILEYVRDHQDGVTTLDILRFGVNRPDGISTAIRRRTNELAEDHYLHNDIIKINNKNIAHFTITEKGRVYLLRLNQVFSPYEA